MNKITHLMPSVAFGETLKDCTDAEDRLYRDNFDQKIMKRPQTLPDLVPCVNGVPVEEPHCFDNFREQYASVDFNSTCAAWYNDCISYEKAKANCLFEGFEVINWDSKDGISKTVFNGTVHAFWFDDASQTWNSAVGKTTIEDYVGYNLPLTSKSIKLIYGR